MIYIININQSPTAIYMLQFKFQKSFERITRKYNSNNKLLKSKLHDARGYDSYHFGVVYEPRLELTIATPRS